MNPFLRRFAVSGGAAIAILAGPAVTVADATEHEATVTVIAQGNPTPVPSDLTTDPGSGAQLQNPIGGQQPMGVNGEQIQTQASGGAIGAGVVAILVLGIIVFVRVRGKDIKVGDAVVVTLFGIAVFGTVIGGLGDQLTDSAISSLGNVLGGL
jgi:hypothetical protein